MSRSLGTKPGTSALVESTMQQVDALGAEPGEAGQVGEAPVERELVDLEVAGVQDQAGGRADRDRERVRDRVVDGEELAVERAEPLALALGDLQRVRPDPVLGSFASISASVSFEPISGMSGLRRSRYGTAPMWSSWRVGQHDRLDVVQAVGDVVEVRQDQVDAGLVGLREQDAAVDDEQPPAVLEHGHVAADLTEPAQRDDAQEQYERNQEPAAPPPFARSARTSEARALAIMAQPGANRYAVAGGEGLLVVAPDGEAALVLADLEDAPEGKTYEAWVSADGTTMEPAGTFQAGDGTTAVALAREVPRGGLVAVTVEDEGGADQPTGDPFLTAPTT